MRPSHASLRRERAPCHRTAGRSHRRLPSRECYWNGGWGYLYFGQLGLYYAHGRWYNPVIALWLSPDEKGEYTYGGGSGGQDAVNEVWTTGPAPASGDSGSGADGSGEGATMIPYPTPTPQPWETRDSGVSKQLLLALTWVGTYSKSTTWPSITGAFMAVGEMESYCGNPTTDRATCEKAFGAVLLTVKNRQKCNLDPVCSKHPYAGGKTLGGIMTYIGSIELEPGQPTEPGEPKKRGVLYEGYSQYRGLERWIVTSPFYKGLSANDQKTHERLMIAESVAFRVFSGTFSGPNFDEKIDGATNFQKDVCGNPDRAKCYEPVYAKRTFFWDVKR